MAMMPTFKSNCYEDGCTVQSLKDSTDVNKILQRNGGIQSVNHLQEFGDEYADFSQWDTLQQCHDRMQRGVEIFQQLPTELQREFKNSPREFFKFVNDAQNEGKLHEVFPLLAQQGNQLPAVNRMVAQKASLDSPKANDSESSSGNSSAEADQGAE